jgi:hypothetical protein
MPAMPPRALIVCCVLVGTSGCAYTRDVTREREWRSGYEVGAVYALRADALMEDSAYGWHPFMDFPSHELLPGDHPVFPSPAAYARDPKRWPRVEGIVPAGTRVRFEKLVYHYYFSGDTAFPYARVLDGPYAGRRVSLRYMSRALGDAAPRDGPNGWVQFLYDPVRLVKE